MRSNLHSIGCAMHTKIKNILFAHKQNAIDSVSQSGWGCLTIREAFCTHYAHYYITLRVSHIPVIIIIAMCLRRNRAMSRDRHIYENLLLGVGNLLPH